MADAYAAMWSGGKDSALATWRARRAGLEVGCLLNFFDAASGRVRFHATRAELIAEQAHAAGIAIRQHGTRWDGFPDAFRAALEELRADGFAGVIFGDIHLADVRAWYEERVRAAGLEHVEPIWGEEPRALLREFVQSGGRAVITCCEEGKLDATWLGRVIDERFVEDIAAVPIDPCGENGEYHSFAFEGPLFRAPVAWLAGERRDDGRFAQLDLLTPEGAMTEVVASILSAHADLAEGVRRERPKAWGALAAQAVRAYRERRGVPLEEAERRALWELLWREVHRAAT